MEGERIKIYQLLTSDKVIDGTPFDEWVAKYFANEKTVIDLYSYLISHKSPTVKDANGNNVFYYTLTKKDFFAKYVCDLPWAAKSTYCGGSGDKVTPNETWSKFTCVTTRPDFKNDASYTYTSSNKDYGVVTLSPNGTFTSTGTKNKGVWSCTASGKIFIEYKDAVTPPKPDSGNSGGLINIGLKSDDLYAGRTVSYGMSGQIVGDIQQLLIDKGFTRISKNGQVDNKFGTLTKQAVRDFQASVGLKVDGVVGKDTWTALNGNAPKTMTTEKPGDAPGADEMMSEGVRKKILRNYLLKHKK